VRRLTIPIAETGEIKKMESEAQPTTTNFNKCYRCGQETRFSVLTIRVVDGDLLGNADYCWQHAMELVEGQPGLPVMLDPDHLGTTLDECYRKRCDCLPKNLDRCTRCTRLADLWVTAGTQEDIEDIERSVELCGPCALAAFKDGTLPVEVREGLREVLDREGKDPIPF
jgi:hypothetical protein